MGSKVSTYIWRKMSNLTCRWKGSPPICDRCCFQCKELDACIELWKKGIFKCGRWCSEAIVLRGSVLGLSDQALTNTIETISNRAVKVIRQSEELKSEET